ncbi:hypothetical protein ACT3TI_13045 [Psychrobacter sp. AOP22-C1-22]|uniref:hypothetical protein n=1 Tax=unclassified Psychrobacter TaxID=196806 RepID=UPI0017881E56|nr:MULTISPECIES: hypothetical protein [unclassified Psychrobacter]MBE0407796.1 hypothetical protein [Psychrobacter sp. FME6]MBE0446324.1 hypothetical protein [Psychrobacter sp. FME5]
MNLELLKQLRTSVVITGLLAGAMTVSACQQNQETDPSLEDGISEEQSVPMSAEPAEPSDVVVDAPVSDVEDDTVATVNNDVTQISYLCAPELAVEATYKDTDNQVVIGTAKGTVTLTKTNDGSNPEVFEGSTAIDGNEGFVQWRVAHKDRETGVMRTAGADASNVSTYECKKTEKAPEDAV